MTYHFPPDGEIGAVRPYQLARRLPMHGIDPWILTVRGEFAESADLYLRAEGISDERILRTSVGRTHRDVLLGWVSAVGTRRESGPSRSASIRPVEGGQSGRAGLSKKFRSWVLHWLAFPDLHIGWYRPAVAAVTGLLATTHFDAIVSSSPPRVAHLVARRFARRYAIPWVMDLRDPWYVGDWVTPDAKSWTVALLQEGLFRICVNRSSALVVTTEALRRRLVEQFPLRHESTFCVPNGCDAAVDGRPTRRVPFTIGHFGQTMGRRSARAFLEGLRAWLDRGKTRRDGLRVRFVGRDSADTEEAIGALGLKAVATCDAAVSRSDVPELMAQQFVLLLLANDQPLQIPGKTYEYLAAGRRILAITEPDGATGELLRSVPGCRMALKPGEIAEALEELWLEHSKGEPANVDHSAMLAGCSYDRRAGQFAEVILSTLRRSAGSEMPPGAPN